jgi:hypothetical protein
MEDFQENIVHGVHHSSLAFIGNKNRIVVNQCQLCLKEAGQKGQIHKKTFDYLI